MMNEARRRATLLVLAAVLCGSATAAACQTLEAPETSDIVAGIPWADREEYTYVLRDDNKVIGSTVLSVERDGDNFLLTQRSADPKGNIDQATIVVAAETLKPLTGTRSITDEEHREVAASCYDIEGQDRCPEVDGADCDSGIIVRIEEQIFDPTDEATPDVPRRAPLCVPEHSYDNDTSLFLWRTIAFEKGYLQNYTTILTGTRRKQTVRIEVVDRVTDTPAGEYDAWVIVIAADGKQQRAWYSADDDHRLLAYQNESFSFTLEE